jgi:hypothetical protein
MEQALPFARKSGGVPLSLQDSLWPMPQAALLPLSMALTSLPQGALQPLSMALTILPQAALQPLSMSLHPFLSFPVTLVNIAF